MNKDIYTKALGLLTRREHSGYELSCKLETKFGREGALEIQEVLTELQGKGFLSDQRYAEAIITYRSKKGYGPNWITAYLKGNGVDIDIIDSALKDSDIDWLTILSRAKTKKFGMIHTSDFTTKAKEFTFLQNRGFSAEQIDVLYSSEELT